MNTRVKYVIVVAFATFICVFISALAVDLKNNTVDQNGDILIYNGVEYLSTKHTDIVADVSTVGYQRVGYGFLNFFPLPVYAKQTNNPDHLVFAGGKVIYFPKSEFPDRISTEYSEVCIECSENGYVKTVVGPLTFALNVLEPVGCKQEDPVRNQYKQIARIECFFANPSNVRRTVKIYEKDGIYYLQDSHQDEKGNFFYDYYPVVEGSDFHELVQEVLADK